MSDRSSSLALAVSSLEDNHHQSIRLPLTSTFAVEEAHHHHPTDPYHKHQTAPQNNTATHQHGCAEKMRRKMMWDIILLQPAILGESAWSTVSSHALFYFRMFALAWSILTLLFSLCFNISIVQSGKWFVFLTHWNASFIFFYFFFTSYYSYRWNYSKDHQLVSLGTQENFMTMGDRFSRISHDANFLPHDSVYSPQNEMSSDTPMTRSTASSTIGGSHDLQPYLINSVSMSLSTSASQRMVVYKPAKFFTKLCYILAEHNTAMSVLVVIVYWTTEFPRYVKTNPSPYGHFTNVCVHGTTLILMLIETWLNRVDFIFPHFLYTVVIAVLYLITNASYCLTQHVYLYEILKWDGFMTAVGIAGASLLLLVTFYLFTLYTKLRNRKSGYVSPIHIFTNGTVDSESSHVHYQNDLADIGPTFSSA